MDPQATLERLLEAFEADNRAHAIAAMQDLIHWLRSGGFVPHAPFQLARRCCCQVMGTRRKSSD
jgi:hypothetical protein